uniref:alpha-glucosidase n=1 Tax=Petromyzon marinus TaxID=7757 RepID=A0AAJ7XF08_PETMA|nr:maltase-glucoamylase, intestinal-like [Petromyzon marinus]XP_032830841.1 maltase-glucoamylase, intestinal-like [Petromyzon marinus]XP_032830843.1 maltase-glucoamylase, intestinal-like [Petromyzon marinus]XP_032830844.1 maltase-glucoamylase, intestinal-like [Petromyzon marinus]XP_032830845.1 maltase-glucoamylase, intestinal-like [Petromyzon marinus]XP_032830846.1 maltase-glucoamylase, intestinal-like [Petromyzon marinus]XP_032830847.1 maltase-glucoamylase, intestinal-like [Petromyzon marinu
MGRRFSGLEVILITISVLFMVAAVALIVVMFVQQPDSAAVEPSCTDPIVDAMRFDCHPDAKASQESCEARGCCWKESGTPNVPWCFYLKNSGGYDIVGSSKTPAGFKYELNSNPAPVRFGGDIINRLLLEVELQTKTKLHFKITDATASRFEVPLVPRFTGVAASETLYGVEVTEKPFGIRVIRKATNIVLFDSSVNPMRFSDQFLQISTLLPSPSIYGLGEHVHQNYRHSTQWKTWPMFTRDAFPNGGTHNLYGHHPFYMCLDSASGSAFGVFLLNLNAMDVTIQPTPALTYRTIGGVLDFYIFLGPSPEEVVQQYHELIGKPMMPAYWALGFQLSRWGYTSLQDVQETVERNRATGMPYDVQYTDIDSMEDRKDFTYDMRKWADLPAFVKDLHDHNQRYVIILDPAIGTSRRRNGSDYIPYVTGTERGAWVNESDGSTPLVGEVWPGLTVFPDYTNPICVRWWVEQCEQFFNEVPYDGFWIDMNEVSNFVQGSVNGCKDNKWNHPAYVPSILDGLLYSKTLCMDAVHTLGRHYDVHSLYGHYMSLATHEAIVRIFGEEKRSIIYSRSTVPGSGSYAGHWLGDNGANWNDIKWAIPGMFEFNLFGFPYIGADICGFFDEPSEELCRRWMQVGAFYPFCRNHNAETYQHQDPASFGANSLLVNSSISALTIRYTLLPYLYTLFHHVHTQGGTVVRPLLHEFPSDQETWGIDRQFLWGAAFLITPVLDPGTTEVQGYIPDGQWYDYETGKLVSKNRQQYTFSIPDDKISLLVRGGHILATQQPATRTDLSRKNPMGLIIAMDADFKAQGNLFWDDGETRDSFQKNKYLYYTFECTDNLLRVTMAGGYTDPDGINIDELRLLGLRSPIGSAKVISSEGGEVIIPTNQVSFDKFNRVGHIRGLGMRLGSGYEVQWEYTEEELFDCYPEANASKSTCESRGCIWKEHTTPGMPWCIYDGGYGYEATGAPTPTAMGQRVVIKRNAGYPRRYHSGSNPTVETLNVDVEFFSNHSLRVKIYDPAKARYEVPVPLNKPNVPGGTAASRLYHVEFVDSPFGIRIIRKSTGKVIWNSQAPGFTFTDRFIQMSALLPSENIYGFGETEHDTFKLKLNWETWGYFSKDQPPGYRANAYGVHPYYMSVEDGANAHSVLLFNSNAMDIVLQPNPAVTYRTTGGILDFYFTLGPSPEEVTQQYTALIGRPAMPPYWSLGFQLCRYGYANDTEILNLYNDMKAAGVPYDTQYGDIDYMVRQLDFTLNKEKFGNFPNLIRHMHDEGMRIIIILDPAIAANETEPYPAYIRGVENDVYMKRPDGQIMFGKVWPDYPHVEVNDTQDWDYQVEHYRAYAAMPDFFRERTARWWQREIEEFYRNPTTPADSMEFDGLWIDMNEPASFVHGSTSGCEDKDLNEPPYMPHLTQQDVFWGLQHKTMCMEALHELPDGSKVQHYNVHSLYGWSQTKPTLDALHNVTGKRGIVVTRSTFPGSGQWSGHWLGDNSARWDNLDKSIIGMMEFSLFGITYTGADICGFFGDSNYDLCARWMQLGAFYPYSRNHNGKGNIRQDPVAWDTAFAEMSKRVLEIRYSLLPYLYTLMHEAHAHGSTVVRPLLHEFLSDNETWAISKQFLWGPALLITPVLEEEKVTVRGYVPDARWYDYQTGAQLTERKEYKEMNAPWDTINLHVRGGYILPTQQPANTTKYSRQKPMSLLVAPDSSGTATGSLFWDDGDGIDTFETQKYFLTTFQVTKNGTVSTLRNRLAHDGAESDAAGLVLESVKVLGIATATITSAKLDIDSSGTFQNVTISQVSGTQILIIELQGQIVPLTSAFTITWE